MTPFEKTCKALEQEIIRTYSEHVTCEQAEKLAARMLHIQMRVSEELRTAELDMRMRKAGLSAVRATVRSNLCNQSEKKPTEGTIECAILTDETVSREQDSFDKAEVNCNHLKRLYGIFENAHIYYRGIAKGTFG